jgi:transcriptional regulator with XRE-family HTH domain
MSITTAQIRGARGILNWSQNDLAERTGISATSIGSIEKGQSQPRESTLQAIQAAFENAGLEFMDNNGVRIRSGNVRTFRGKEGFLEFYEDIYQTLKKLPGEVCVSNVDEKVFVKWAGEILETHSQRMQEISGISYKILIKEGDMNFVASEYAQYRWIKKELFSSVPFYVYGDKLGIVLFGAVPNVIVIENKAVSDAYRIHFLALWEDAGSPGR